MPKIILDFPTQGDMDMFKALNMWDVEPDPEAEAELDERMKYDVTITEED